LRAILRNPDTDLLFDMNTLPIEHCAEYDAAAEWYAKYSELPANMAIPGAITSINDDPEAFFERVKAFQYALAMEATQ